MTGSITDEVRRDVAKELRRFGEDGSLADVIYSGTECYDQMLVRVLRQVVGKGDLFERLANLIDRPTCTMTECRIDHGPVSWGICCSRCNDEFEHAFHNEFSYCPNYGAEVVE